MVSHVYDTTYEVIRKGIDTVVVIDDSIVRGTTLEKSIITMLNRLEPKKIVVVSSAPQIRYPDCYGIDMSKMKEFVAFRAVLGLIQDTHQDNLLDEVYEKCLAAKANGTDSETNFVQLLYKPFSASQISNKIAEIITPKNTRAEVSVVYQTIEGLHVACPNHTGDWYFTGNYPTPGGNRVVNQAFINFMENKLVRAY
jgi:amidophosphoribosyltransferase